MRFNVNHYVKVKITERGMDILRKKHAEWVNLGVLTSTFTPPKTDADGWSEWQMHDLMHTFGEHMYMGPPAPFETTIQIIGNKDHFELLRLRLLIWRFRVRDFVRLILGLRAKGELE